MSEQKTSLAGWRLVVIEDYDLRLRNFATPDAPPLQLYNVQADPRERENQYSAVFQAAGKTKTRLIRGTSPVTFVHSGLESLRGFYFLTQLFDASCRLATILRQRVGVRPVACLKRLVK